MQKHLRLHVGPDHCKRAWGPDAIVDLIQDQLQQSSIPLGLHLPPIDFLATQLGAPAATILSAYRILAHRSLVEHDGDGQWVVATPNRDEASIERRSPPPLLVKPTVPANRPARGTPGYITLSSAFLDTRLIPVEEFKQCVQSALRSPGPPTYAHIQGYPPLRELIAKRLKKRGIETDPEHIVITIGSQQVLDLVCRSIEIKRVATECPAYIAAKALFRLSGIETAGLPVDPFTGIDRDVWRRILSSTRPSLAYLTSNFQNPTGYSYTSKELYEILEWADEFHFAILEDDWGSDMLPLSSCKPTLRALGGENVLYMNAFTKKALPSLRVGYVVCNERTLPSLLQSKKLSINGFPAMVEESLFELIAQGYYDRYLATIQKELRTRYTNCVALLRSLLPDCVQWTLPGGGPILWLEFPPRISVERLIEDLRERKVLVNPQDSAFFGVPHLNGFMLGYGFPDCDEMTIAIEALADALALQLRPSAR